MQLVLDDFILKKKKGPFLSRGMQVIHLEIFLETISRMISGDILEVHCARLSLHGNNEGRLDC